MAGVTISRTQLIIGIGLALVGVIALVWYFKNEIKTIKEGTTAVVNKAVDAASNVAAAAAASTSTSPEVAKDAAIAAANDATPTDIVVTGETTVL